MENILISENMIKEKVKLIAKQVYNDFKDENFIIISLLNGSFLFTADFVRELSRFTLNFSIFFLRAKSYSLDKSTGKVTFYDKLPDLTDKSILLIDDILDTGLTLKSVVTSLKEHRLKTLKILFFLIKDIKRSYKIHYDYFCFKIPDLFVVGYGLDYNEKYRGLPYISYLKF